MGKQEFDLVMSEVENIATAVEKFPEGAQGAACTALVNALLLAGTDFPNGSAKANGHQSQGDALPSGNQAKAVDRDYVGEIKRDFAAYNLDAVSDIQIAAYTAHYFIEVAPDAMRVRSYNQSAIGKSVCNCWSQTAEAILRHVEQCEKSQEPVSGKRTRQGNIQVNGNRTLSC